MNLNKNLKTFEYRGYTGVVIYDKNIFHGRIILNDSTDIITFSGLTLAEAEQQFRNGVNDYLGYPRNT